VVWNHCCVIISIRQTATRDVAVAATLRYLRKYSHVSTVAVSLYSCNGMPSWTDRNIHKRGQDLRFYSVVVLTPSSIVDTNLEQATGNRQQSDSNKVSLSRHPKDLATPSSKCILRSWEAQMDRAVTNTEMPCSRLIHTACCVNQIPLFQEMQLAAQAPSNIYTCLRYNNTLDPSCIVWYTVHRHHHSTSTSNQYRQHAHVHASPRAVVRYDGVLFRNLEFCILVNARQVGYAVPSLKQKYSSRIF
jgi:hypothetical protein